jgi:hypothetical protein
MTDNQRDEDPAAYEDKVFNVQPRLLGRALAASNYLPIRTCSV